MELRSVIAGYYGKPQRVFGIIVQSGPTFIGGSKGINMKIITDLSGPMYGNVISHREALKLIAMK